jgi:hypothetical protein
MNWKEAVSTALQRYSNRHGTVQVSRSTFVAEELEAIVSMTGSAGKTPDQTLSRVLQDLRDDGILYFARSGVYVLNTRPLAAEREDFQEDILENAAEQSLLSLGDIVAGDAIGMQRIREGVAALRKVTLRNYKHSCALCDIHDSSLLVSSHVARWADNPDARGHLRNVICFCRFHDSLFEHGYIGLTDNLEVLRKPNVSSRSISVWLDQCTDAFKVPEVPPAPEYLHQHRKRVNLN